MSVSTPLRGSLTPLGSKRPASSAFDWTAYSGAIARWDAANIGGLSAGDPVTTWDESTNTYDATGSGATRPTYRTSSGPNSQPWVDYDGTDFLQFTVLPSATVFSIYSVISFNDTTTNRKIWFSNRKWALEAFTTPIIRYIPDVDTTVAGSVAYAASTWYLVTIIHGASNAFQVRRSGASPSTGTSVALDTATTNNYLGNYNTAPTIGLRGGLADLLYYEAEHNSTDRDAIESALASRYGITL